MKAVLKKVTIMGAVAVFSAHAEDETLNIFGSVGAGFGVGGRLYRSTESINNNTTVTDRFFNYGSGAKFDLGCQYFMMENVALQTSFGYSVGLPFEQKSVVALNTTITTYKGHMFGVKAMIVPRFEILELLDLYTGVGLGFFWNSRPFKAVSVTEIGQTEISQEAKGKITSKPALGFLGQLGADYPLNDNLTLFGEVAFEEVSFNLSKFKVEESSIPGISSDTYLENDASNLPPEKVPGSNWQIRIGVRYSIIKD